MLGKVIKYLIGPGFKWIMLLILTCLSTTFFAQVDTEFWFVVPEISHRGSTGGKPGTMRFATLELDATVTIEMPANPAFVPIVLNIPANDDAAVDFSYLIDDISNPGIIGLENKPLTPDGINPYGLHITATNMINAYWEVNYIYGADIWTMKGSNGLGTLFYTPFQTEYPNHLTLMPSYSAIDVVATQDNTILTFTLPDGVGASFGEPMTNIMGITPGATFNIGPLMQGETFSLFPYMKNTNVAAKLDGTRVSSTFPVAVVLKDDNLNTASQGRSTVGDQIVPVSITGDTYVVPAMGNPNLTFVVATQDNTNIYIDDVLYATINEGEQIRIQSPNNQVIVISSKNNIFAPPGPPFYALHLALSNMTRAEALLPPIGCTGNTQLAFTRAREEIREKFYFFLITENENIDKFMIDGTPADPTIIPDDITKWVQLGNGWSAYMTSNIPASKLTIGQHLVENTGGIFHLALMNGFTSANLGDMFYGYFSDYGGLNVGAVVAGTNSSVIRACYGTPVQLYAYGGTNYEWTPHDYLDDPYSNLPFAINLPPGAHEYIAHVSGACGSGDVPLTVVVAPPVTAHFETNVTSGCSPLTVEFEDQSVGNATWQYDLGDGTPLMLYDTLSSTIGIDPPPNPFVFSNTYVNKTDSVITFEVTLMVKNSSACADIITKTIVVFPEINSDFTVAPDDACDPLESFFTNLSSGDTATWLWEFGDGGSSTERDPVHLYRNIFGPDNLIFDASLVAISPYNCRDTSTRSVTVRPYIEAIFAYDTVAECSPHEIIITDESIGADNYLWNFGDGTTSTSSGPILSHTYVNNGPVPITYTITLDVSNEEGCTHQVQRDVTIYPDVEADFSMDPPEACSPAEVMFSNLSIVPPGTVYLWDFGDGGTSTEVEPVHLYDRNLLRYDTVFTVTLVAITQEDCRDTAIFDVVIHPYIEAAFTVEDVVGCDPFEVEIHNESIGVDNYYWDFGDGSTSTSGDPVITHIYNNPGSTSAVYPLRLIVTNTEGCRDTMIRNITVHPLITSNFSFNTDEGCHPLTVNFTDLSVNAEVYLWDFGDGAATVEPSPVHTFTNFGTSDSIYTVTLTTSTADGECVKSISWDFTVHPNVEAAFTFPQAVDCGPFDVTFENLSIGGTEFRWDFGDGNTLTTFDTLPVTHTFINTGFVDIQDFDVVMVAENLAGCTDTARKVVRVYPAIESNFSASAIEGCQPLEVDFTDLSVGAQTYLWDFGDGTSSNFSNPSHTFTNTGNVDSIYTVTLVTIAPNNICRDTFTLDITVHPYLQANFTIPVQSGCNPFDAIIENSSINATQYHWDFGDGTDTTTFNLDPFTHRFTNSDFINQQDFIITLTAENFAGCTSVQSRIVTVEPDIQADLTVSQNEGCHPLLVDFTNNTDGGSYYIWDFGDGTSSSQQDPSHLFTNTGTVDSVYTVKLLSVAPNNICRDSIFIDITVHPYVSANFVVTDKLGCNPFDVTIENASVNASIFNWDFGDGSDTITLNTNPFIHRFTNSDFINQQDYDITLVAENFAGCTDEITRTITVEPAILAEFSADLTEGCHPLTVNFSNLTNGAAYYLWDFGNGTTSQAVDPTQTFTNIGSTDTTYRVWLYATASNNVCRDSFFIDIVVHPFVQADFTFLESIHCSPSTVTFENASVGGQTFLWDFGDGSDTTTTDMNPVDHIFNNTSYSSNSILQVTLLVTNFAGCTDQITKNVEVYPDIEANFDVDTYEGCHPLEVSFSNLSSGGYTYYWDFGDGSSTSAKAPTHSYTNFTDDIIIRQVSLVATSRYDCTHDTTMDIIIHPMPRASFETEKIIDCPQFDVSLENTSLNADQFRWVFDDGSILDTTEAGPLSHVYDNQTGDIATYNMKLIASSVYGCTDSIVQKIYVYPATIADFSSNREGCSPLTVHFTNESVRGNKYLWDFGDGSMMSVTDPTNIYFNFSPNDTMFRVTLTSTSTYGCVDTHMDSIYVYPQPDAEFIATPTHQEYPSATVSLTDASNEGPWNYLWLMGDGASSTLENPDPHTYGTWGNYQISLYISSDHCNDSVFHSIRIFPGVPVASFDTVYAGCEPLTVQFNNTSIFGDSYLWEFDDGDTSSLFSPEHTFTEAGIYNVKLTVEGEGGRDYAYRMIEVYPNPIVDFRVAPQLVMLPDQHAQFFNLSEYADFYVWDFGDGQSSTEESPAHVYEQIGVYDVTLDAWTGHGCTARMVMPNAVTVMGEGMIRFPDAFKPDMDGPNGGHYDPKAVELNNIFHPLWEGVEDYHLQVYSRWGELLFTSNHVLIGWDGYFNGTLCAQGVYVWKCIGTFSNGQNFNLAGNVTLLYHNR